MYSSSETNQYQKYENPPTTDQISKYSTPPPPSQFSHQDHEVSATGIPVSSTGQFAPLQIESQPLVPWSTGLCDCFSDFRNCCITCWCPCITFGRIAEIIDRGSSSCGMNGALYTLIMCVTGCTCLYSCFYRAKLRSQYHLEGSPCLDCLVHCFCESCALCQEYRELKIRGFDISLGWHGNVEKQSRGITTLPPAIAAGMSRQ